MIDRKEKFTPGSWSITTIPCDLYREWCIADPTGGIIATARAFAPRWEGEANAHLIAATPDLYEALAELLDISKYSEWNDGGDRLDAALESGLAALAKARGESE